MSVAVSFSEEDWWPFPQATVTDLLAFIEDGESAAEPAPVVALSAVANDNWPLHVERASVNELPPIARWTPRFRTAD